MIEPASETATTFGTAEWLEFAAHLHPVLLHLPIGLLVAAFLLEVWSLFRPDIEALRRTTLLVLAVTAALAAASGWLLGSGPDYAGELVDQHRTLGVVAALLALCVALLDLFGRSGSAAFLRRTLLVTCALVMTVAGHRGGTLTHGRGFLADRAPAWLAPWLAGGARGEQVTPVDDGLREAAGDTQLVLAALAARCFECHGPDKSKAGLRLDQAEGLLSTLLSGDPEQSEILRRVRLAREHEDAMPPSGAPLAAEAVSALERWIRAGAPLESVEQGLAQARAAREARQVELDQVRAATGAVIETLLDAPDEPGAPASPARLSVDWSRASVGPDAQQLGALASLAGRVVELRLAGRPVSDAALEALPELPVLARVHLERTPVGDAGLATLVERAPQLRYVNLHSSRISAAALAPLGTLEHLERLVLFGTSLTAAQTDAFARERPALTLTLDGPELRDDPFGARQPRRILAADASTGRIALLREVTIGVPQLLWEHPIEAIHDMQWLADTSDGHGRVLFQETWTRVLEVDTATNEVLWSYDAGAADGAPVEVHSFQRLDDGRTMVAESGRGRLAFVDEQGAVVGEIALRVDEPSAHHDTRLVRATDTGTFLVAHEREGVVREYATDGAVVWEYAVPLFERERAPGHGPGAHGNQVFGALRLADGDTLITTGNGSSLLRVRPNGSLRWHLGQDDVPGVRLAWTTVIQELQSGHLVLGNCHAGPDQPQALELTPEGELVWSFRDHELFGDALSNLVVVEEAH